MYMNNEAHNAKIIFSSDAWKGDIRNSYRIYKKSTKGTLCLDEQSFSFIGDSGEVHFKFLLNEISRIEFRTGNYFNIFTTAGKRSTVFLYDVDNADHGAAFPLTYQVVVAGDDVSQKWISTLHQYVSVDIRGRRKMRSHLNFYMIIGAVLGGIVAPLAIAWFYFIA